MSKTYVVKLMYLNEEKIQVKSENIILIEFKVTL